MQTWQVEWEAVSTCIASLVEAGSFLVASAQVTSADPYQARKVLVDQAVEIFGLINNFKLKYVSQLPTLAQQRLQAFCDRNAHLFGAGDITRGTPENLYHGLQLYVALLAAFRTEFTYLLSNEKQLLVQSLVDRAFLHLQRSIAADPGFAQKWQEAFEHHETACEKLGGVHLLQFGIYTFKAQSAGEQTDLILGTKFQLTPEIERATEALVLTEWKLVKSAAALSVKIEEAHQQATRYAVGSLAGFELALHRYLVMVSSDILAMPGDRQDGPVVYHHKNVAVRPSLPSQHA